MTWECIALHHLAHSTQHDTYPSVCSMITYYVSMSHEKQQFRIENYDKKKQISRTCYYVWHHFQITQYLITAHDSLCGSQNRFPL